MAEVKFWWQDETTKQPPDAKGYDPSEVPANWGRTPIYPECCRIFTEGPKDCGCSMGRCERGGIL